MKLLTSFYALLGSAILLAAAGCHHSRHAYRERCDDDVIVIHQHDHHDYRWRESGHDRGHDHDYHDYRGSDRHREYSRSNDDGRSRDRFEQPSRRGQ